MFRVFHGLFFCLILGFRLEVPLENYCFKQNIHLKIFLAIKEVVICGLCFKQKKVLRYYILNRIMYFSKYCMTISALRIFFVSCPVFELTNYQLLQI